MLHPAQQARLENKLPAYTVGSLIGQIKVASMLSVIRDLVLGGDAEVELRQLSETLQRDFFTLKASNLRISGRKVGVFEAGSSFEARIAA